MSDQREQLNEMKKFRQLMEDISEGKERPYVCHHNKKGEHECTADSSYGAAKKAAKAWGLDSTAGVSATLADVKQSTQFVGEGDPDDTDWDAHWAREDGDDERADDLEADAEWARMDDELDEAANDNWGVGDFVVTVWDEAGRHSEPLKVTGVRDDQVRVVDEHGNTALMFPEDLRLAPNEVSEANFYDIMRTNRDEDDEPYIPRDRHAERPHTPGYDKQDSGAKAAADSRAKAFMFDEDADEDGMGSYDIIWDEDTWKEAVPYDQAEKEVQRILQIIEDSALQAHGNNDHIRVKKVARGNIMVWTVLDPSDGDYQEIRVEPSDMPAGYTGESIELDSIVESVLEEYPGQPKDYEMSDDELAADDEFENDRIDPEIEDEELGLRFD